MANQICDTCKEVKTVFLKNIESTRKNNGTSVLIKDVPAEKCGCDTLIPFRVGLEMSYYQRTDKSQHDEIDFSVIKSLCSAKSNIDLIEGGNV